MADPGRLPKSKKVDLPAKKQGGSADAPSKLAVIRRRTVKDSAKTGTISREAAREAVRAILRARRESAQADS